MQRSPRTNLKEELVKVENSLHLAEDLLVNNFTQNLDIDSLIKANVYTPRYYDRPQVESSHLMLNLSKSAAKFSLNQTKPKGTPQKRPAKPILEEQEFRCHEEGSVNRVNMKYKGLLDPPKHATKPIKKVFPSKPSNSVAKVGIPLTKELTEASIK